MWGRIATTAWSIALYVLGSIVEVLALMSVPGTRNDDESTGAHYAYWAVSLILWASVFFRRRHPIAPIAAGGVLALAGSSYFLLFLGLHHAMLRSSMKNAVRIGAVAVVIALLSVIRAGLAPWGDGLDRLFLAENPWLVSAFFAIASTGTLLAVTAIVRSRRTGDAHQRTAEVARGRADQLGDELARRNERERIARDIHDTLAHRLSLLSLQGGALEVAVAGGDSRAVEIARTMRSESHRALDDLRGLLGELRAGPAETEGVQASMRSIGELVRSARAAGATVDAMIMVEGADRAAAILDSTVYRVVQEALTNAVKHAQGAPVSIYAEASPGAGVRIRVSNPLRDASAVSERGSGAGIVGIRERAEQLEGEAWIGAHEGEFIVDVSFPWVGRTADDSIAHPAPISPDV